MFRPGYGEVRAPCLQGAATWLAVGLGLLASAACATVSSPTAVTTTSAERERPPLVLDVGALHPRTTSRTRGDARALSPELLARVSLERGALIGADGVEPWLSRILFAWLVEHGAEVRAADAGATSRLVGVRFTQAKEEVEIAVTGSPDQGTVAVRFWAGKKDTSLCAPALKVPLTVVTLEGELLDANARVVVAFAEAVVVPPPAMAVELEPGGRELCALISGAFVDELVPTETEHVASARRALDSALGPLFPAP